ncbi:MAG: hypothetical protein Q7S40_10150 [Opitutaceae bacterium]|nr:hypothetical protein [Opitutaceae bacterium]
MQKLLVLRETVDELMDRIDVAGLRRPDGKGHGPKLAAPPPCGDYDSR